MSLWERFKAHPVVVSFVGIVATVVAVVSGFALLQAIWALFSSDPFFPVIGEWISQWSESLMAVLLVLGLAALIGWMVYIQWRIFTLLREPEKTEDVLPENTTWAEGYLTAGSDVPLDIPTEDAKTAEAVTFTARQGTRYLFKGKAGEVDRELGRIRLPFTVAETKRLKTGHLLIEVTFISAEGTRLKGNRMAIKTIESL